MKNIEMICATIFTSPISTKKNAIAQVMRVAFTGSPSPSLFLVSQVLIFLEGKDLSVAKVCKVRGATMTAPKAEDMVAAANPKGTTMNPNTAMSDIIICLLAKSLGLAETANLYATKK